MQKFSVLLQYLVPQHALSRFIGKIANCRWRWVKNTFIRWYIHHYKVDMSLAAEPDWRNYPTFNAFFTRPLKNGVRPIADNNNGIISPVDGLISQIGNISAGKLIQAKGFDFTVTELLGNAPWAGQFSQGKFTTIYLAPRDYHRIHMPITGDLREMWHIPGQLFSVNPVTAASIPGLFARNERVVSLFDTPVGSMAIVLVGAIIVASIATTWAGVIHTSKQHDIRHWEYEAGQHVLPQGVEMGQFMLGSTVILLFANHQLEWLKQPETAVQMGQLLGLTKDN